MGGGGRARRSEAFRRQSVCDTAGTSKQHLGRRGGKRGTFKAENQTCFNDRVHPLMLIVFRPFEPIIFSIISPSLNKYHSDAPETFQQPRDGEKLEPPPNARLRHSRHRCKLFMGYLFPLRAT